MTSFFTLGNACRRMPLSLGFGSTTISRSQILRYSRVSYHFRHMSSFTTQSLRPLQGKPQYRASMSPRTRATSTSSSGEKTSDDNEADVLCSIERTPAAGEGVVATVTLSNPRRLNSLSRSAIAKLTSTLTSLASQPDLRCVVIKGSKTETKSPSFTSGADIFQMAKLKSYDEAKKFITELHEACEAMRNLPVVTIAQIDGLCLGGGLELAAACDFRFATQTSTFSMPETKYGIPSVIEARLLANIIGWQKTKEMVYFARFYNASEMEGWGLIDKSCKDAEELAITVKEAVQTITSFGSKTMREQKRLVKIWEETDLKTGVEAGIDSYARLFEDGGSEPGHYMKAFTERKG